eukprot:TRINITY_DN9574_c0_g1_i1.p1 TRINITY_DN9574_c0_g1~~TRINITY_DN9574_c0_g1_i1.p1  ORF type:complete len:325 (-),score=71.29 TRINITY_DN9574_c0_g1_i1:384-1358(-)
MAEKSLDQWAALLRWSTNHHDGTSPSAQNVMDPERRRFLENVMKSMTINIPSRMKEILEFLKKEEVEGEDLEKLIDDKIEQLQELAEYVESIDFAQDLHKMGGLELIIKMLSHPNYRVSFEAASVLHNVVHNNPSEKANAIKLGVATVLTHQLQQIDYSGDTEKLLYQAQIVLILTDLIENADAIAELFAQLGAFDYGVLLLKAPTPDSSVVLKLKRRVLKFVQTGFQMPNAPKLGIDEVTLVDALVHQVGEGDDVLYRDAVASFLASLSQGGEAFLYRLRLHPETIQIVQARLRTIDAMSEEDRDSCQEEHRDLSKLLEALQQ